jgi:probable rRNA maturation factor
MIEGELTVTKTVRGNPPSGLPLARLRDAILGKKYNLSVTWCGDHLSRRLNRTYRSKDASTDILSFPLDQNEGELYVNLGRLEHDAARFKVARGIYAQYLLIHGLMHLKGLDHGSRMEHEEQEIRRKFGIPLD